MPEKTLQEKPTDNQVWEIPLEHIRPAPWNPPSRMAPEKVKELAESIRIEGQQSPALIRPVEGESPIAYEIVWGHRRYAALQLLAGQTFTYKPAREGNVTIRAFIRELSEEQAMISSGIENLQREGFSDIEEAEFFRTCGDRYGESAVKVLAEKLSVSDRYIRKRLEILKLPETALELWRSGTWHVGHMEQLLRLGDNEQVGDFLINFDERRLKEIRVWELQDMVGRQAVPLHSGKFDKTECKTCQKNTDCQHRLFGLEKEKGAKCLDQKCFIAKQQAWLDVNWPTCKENKFGTQAAIIGDWNTKSTGVFSVYGDKPGEKCKTCSHFTTILSLIGHNKSIQTYHDQVCMGEAACFTAIGKAGKKIQKEEKGKQEEDGPRVAWHGEYYRQEFYHQEIPRLMEGLPPGDPRHLKLTLAALLYSGRTLHEWFWQRIGRELPKLGGWQHFSLSFHKLLQAADELEVPLVKTLISETLVKIAMRKDRGYEISFSDADRQALAEFLDIDFSRFQVTEEYLNKKTKAELVRFIAHDSGLSAEAAFLEAMKLRGYATIEKLAAAKKPNLVELLLQCGVNLRGRLPQEIANRPKLCEELPA